MPYDLQPNGTSPLSRRRFTVQSTRSFRKATISVAFSAIVTAASVIGLGAAAAAPPLPQPQGTCGQEFNPSTAAGHAHWTLTCVAGKVTMQGYVTDDRADGECAQVRAVFSNATYFSQAACPKGTTINFKWTGPGNVADGYLQFFYTN